MGESGGEGHWVEHSHKSENFSIGIYFISSQVVLFLSSSLREKQSEKSNKQFSNLELD